MSSRRIRKQIWQPKKINYFETLPNEILYEMCQDWDDQTLINMSETHKRIGIVCQDIISERKKEAEIKKIEEEIVKYEYLNEVAKFYKRYPDDLIIVDVITGPRILVISQIFFKPDAVESEDTKPINPEIPWVLSPSGIGYDKTETSRFALLDRSSKLIRQLAENLYAQGYKMVN